MLDGMSDSIQRSRIEKLYSREVDRQSPTGLIFYCLLAMSFCRLPEVLVPRTRPIRWLPRPRPRL